MSGEEDRFLTAVVNLAHTTGWIVSHHKLSVQLIRDKNGKVVGRRSNIVGDRGIPDLQLVHPVRYRFMLRELKRDLGPRGGGDDVSLSEDQERWDGALRLVQGMIDQEMGGKYAGYYFSSGVWRPAMLDEIAAELAR